MVIIASKVENNFENGMFNGLLVSFESDDLKIEYLN